VSTPIRLGIAASLLSAMGSASVLTHANKQAYFATHSKDCLELQRAAPPPRFNLWTFGAEKRALWIDAGSSPTPAGALVAPAQLTPAYREPSVSWRSQIFRQFGFVMWVPVSQLAMHWSSLSCDVASGVAAAFSCTSAGAP
jgi:hypothetical protein